MNDPSFAGRHLIIDAYVHDADVLRDTAMLDAMLEDIADLLDMDIILGPINTRVPEKTYRPESNEFHDTGGVTGFCVVSTSHIAYHTWPGRKFISMDIFSCKDYDPNPVVDYILDYLSVSSYKRHDKIRRAPQTN